MHLVVAAHVTCDLHFLPWNYSLFGNMQVTDQFVLVIFFFRDFTPAYFPFVAKDREETAVYDNVYGRINTCQKQAQMFKNQSFHVDVTM